MYHTLKILLLIVAFVNKSLAVENILHQFLLIGVSEFAEQAIEIVVVADPLVEDVRAEVVAEDGDKHRQRVWVVEGEVHPHCDC